MYMAFLFENDSDNFEGFGQPFVENFSSFDLNLSFLVINLERYCFSLKGVKST